MTRALLAALGLALAVLAAAVPPADAAPVEVDQEKACLACHQDLESVLRARFPHPPAAAAECTACHNPHVSRFGSLLREQPGPLCQSCHAGVTAELEKSSVHPPAADGRCGDCHEPHGGAHDGLLRSPVPALCTSCHSEIPAWQARPVQHAPFAAGDCSSCHQPHGGDHPGLSESPAGSRCGSCHEIDASFTRAHNGYPVQQAPCQQCHDPHASARPGLFRAELHAPFEAGDCSLCHALPGSPEPFRTRASQDQLCGDCHADAVESSRTAPFPHVSAGGASCTACHNPHTADGAGLLKAPQASLCTSCHDPGGASSGQPGRYPGHGDGLDCSTCHAPHGGSRPQLFTDASIELCAACHSHQHSATHPLGEETRDPRNGQAMDCLSCHGIHDAPHAKYLHLAGERDLCLSCHRELAEPR